MFLSQFPTLSKEKKLWMAATRAEAEDLRLDGATSSNYTQVTTEHLHIQLHAGTERERGERERERERFLWYVIFFFKILRLRSWWAMSCSSSDLWCPTCRPLPWIRGSFFSFFKILFLILFAETSSSMAFSISPSRSSSLSLSLSYILSFSLSLLLLFPMFLLGNW